MKYDIYGDVGRLNELADNQQSYHARFAGIMDGISTAATQTMSQWSGAGQEGFTATSVEYEQLYESVQQAFTRLIGSTRDSAESYAGLTRSLQSLFN